MCVRRAWQSPMLLERRRCFPLPADPWGRKPRSSLDMHTHTCACTPIHAHMHTRTHACIPTWASATGLPGCFPRPSAFGLPTCRPPDAQATPLLLAPRFSLYSIRKKRNSWGCSLGRMRRGLGRAGAKWAEQGVSLFWHLVSNPTELDSATFRKAVCM